MPLDPKLEQVLNALKQDKYAEAKTLLQQIPVEKRNAVGSISIEGTIAHRYGASGHITPEGLKTLQTMGVDLTVKDGIGGTIVHHYAYSGQITSEGLNALKAAGCDLKAKETGASDCTIAHEYGHSDHVTREGLKALKDAGIDLTAKDKKGRTVAHYYCGSAEATPEGLKLLKETGVDITAKDNKGETIVDSFNTLKRSPSERKAIKDVMASATPAHQEAPNHQAPAPSGKTSLAIPHAETKVAAWQEAMNAYVQKHQELHLSAIAMDGAWGKDTTALYKALFKDLGNDAHKAIAKMKSDGIQLHPDHFELAPTATSTTPSPRTRTTP